MRKRAMPQAIISRLSRERRFAQLHPWIIGGMRAFGGILSSTVVLGWAIAPGQAQTPPPSPRPAPTSVAVTRPTLQMGSQGDSVRQLQALLQLLGFYTGAVDGIYGPGTAMAVADFQEMAGLTPDGIMGTATWNQLLPPLSALIPATAAPAPSPGTVESSAATESESPATTTESTTAEPTATEPAIAETTTNAAESPTSPAPTDTEATDFPVLRIGAQGPAVERLQERLQALGFYQGGIDGIFGEATKAAVETAQRNYGINPDGVVGPVTWSVLLGD
jgi:N-acetylmuramoyl-L-alanine amidase